MARNCSALSVVVVRLDPTIQYCGTPATDLRSRGAPDTPSAGMTAVFFALAFGAVIARSDATKQSSFLFAARWIASLTLAMTLLQRGLLFDG
jgi:hypothetical protein